MFPNLKLYAGCALALVIVALVGWLFWSRASLKADLNASQANVAALELANNQTMTALQELRGARDASQAALATREKRLNEISAQRDALRLQLKEAAHNDNATRTWFDEPLPGAVRGLLWPR